MRQRADAFAAMGAEVVVVTCYQAADAARYRSGLALPFPCLVDPERRVHRLYGLRTGALREAFHPTVGLTYLRPLARGERLRAPGGDIRQLGGDFVIGRVGRVVLARYSRTPADRPGPSTLESACRAAANGA